MLKYIDGRDCAQQEKLVGGLVEMIQWGGKPPEKKPRWGGLAVKGGQAELIGGILFINR